MIKTTISNGWRQVPLAELLELNQSGTWGDEGGENDYPVLRSSNIHNGNLILTDVAYRKIPSDKIADYKLDNGDILVTKSSGSSHLIGKSCIFRNFEKKCYLFSNFTQRLRTKKEVLLPELLYYYLNSSFAKETLQRISNTTSGLRNLNMKEYGKQLIPVPPIPVQKKVAAILEKADAAREKRRQANQLTEQFLQSAFLEMFGDPVTNPKKWEKNSIGEITSIVTSGLTPRGGANNYLKVGPYFLRSQNIKMNHLDLTDIACLPKEIHESMEHTKVQYGDVLLNITGASIGRVAWYNIRDHEANVNQHVCIIRLKDRAFPQYISYFLSTQYGQYLINNAQSGATRQGLNHENIRKIKIPIPPLSEQQKFAELVEKVDVLRTKQYQSEQELETLFNSLMQRAFRGEL